LLTVDYPMDYSLLESCRVLPVITAYDVDTTVQLVAALQRAGMVAVEITLRTDAALDSISAVRAHHPQLLVAAGTITSAADVRQAVDAGAQLLVSPGLTADLLDSARQAGAALLPGVATASEVMLGMAHGHTHFKLFPAQAAGGIALLKSLAGPFPGIRFCPTGGLTVANYRDFLALPNVICCGGSWMVAPDLVKNGNWTEIERLAAQAMSTAA
jgi:2-dehydro-3-deoxyphosphogluconate aldolase/(4S)-4-hydroxy-2-oxoglutarate aldolase